ncbi:MAG: hypothetical protein ACO225_06690 [Ilumatobacteraceae bacterium]
MPIVAVSGDTATTTGVALAASWPEEGGARLIEADPSGGDLAAWFDLPESPSLSTLVTRLRDRSSAELDAHLRPVGDGLRVVTCPAMPSEADLAVSEAAAILVPMLRDDTCWSIVDIGRRDPCHHPFGSGAEVIVMVHRQATQSARAAAVRLRRLPDLVAQARSAAPRVVVAVVGRRPFDFVEIEGFLAASVAGAGGDDLTVVGLADDPLAAAVLGGRSGVSGRRLARLPLMRTARTLAGAVLSVPARPRSVGARWR